MLADDKLGPEELVIRPSRSSDIGDFYTLASLAGAGFTSLPANEAILAERLAGSKSAFGGGPGVLMLALEDRRTETVVGCAAVKPAGLQRSDFLNFLIDDDDAFLQPTARYADLTEVGSLLLHPDYRRNGIGSWLSRSRYLLIAGALGRFGASIFSELRGVVDDEDQSPFYDAVCFPYFQCSFAEADAMSARGEQAKLNALLPKTAFPLKNLGENVLSVIGRPHSAGRRALDYLKDDGFRFEGVVDLLDGGPAVVARSRSIKTIRQSFLASVRPGRLNLECSSEAYIAVGEGSGFRCGRSPVTFDRGIALCPKETLVLLGAGTGATARVHLVDESRAGVARDQQAISQAQGYAGQEAGLDR